jgi:hypothetical protein
MDFGRLNYLVVQKGGLELVERLAIQVFLGFSWVYEAF